MKSILLLLLSLSLVTSLFSQNTLDNAGLTASTPASVAFSLRKLSSSYAGYPVKVRRASDNAEANLAFDGSNMVTASSMATFTPGVVIGATLGVTQTGTINTDIARTGTVTIAVNKTGTITATNGSLTVTGTGTNFTTEIVVGDRLFNATNNIFLGVVASITNNTTLLLNNYATNNITSIAYKTANAVVTGTGTNFTGELSAGDRIFNTTNTYLGTVNTVINATTINLNAVDAVAATAIAYKGTTNNITGTGTNFTTLSAGDLLISNNTTLGIISSINNATSLTLTTKSGASVSGLAFKSTAGTITFSAYFASTSVYVNTWYDQSGNGRDAIQLKPANQPRIVNAGTLYTVNTKASMEFSGTLSSYLQTTTAASYLNNTAYTVNKVTAEATINPANQFPLTTTGGNGPMNTILHFGYRSPSLLTLAQLSHDHNFNSSATTSLETHTAVKFSAAASQMYRNAISLGTANNGPASYLLNAGLLNIGLFLPTNVQYNGSISEIVVFTSAMGTVDLNLLHNNQITYFNIPVVSWTGALSADWNNTGNWSTGAVPTISSPDIVLIPAGKPFYPVIDILTVQANSISIDAGASLTVNGSGVLQLAGTINNLGTCNFSSGTVEYVGTVQQGIGAGTYTGGVLNLIINNSAGVQLNGSISVSGNLTFKAGKLSIYTATLTIGGIVTNTVAGGLKGEPNSSIIVTGNTSPTLSFDQTTHGLTNILRNLTINSAGQTVTLANNLMMVSGGTTTFTAGKLALGSNTLTLRGAVVNTANEGIRGSAASNLIIDGTSSATLSFDQTTPGTTNALNNLTLNNSGQTTTLNRGIAIISSLTITTGTLADGGNQVTSTGTLNLIGGTLKLGSATVATVWPAFTTNTISAGGTVEYAAGILQTVSAVPVYQNLTISAAAGTIAAADLTVNNILNLSAANPSATTGSLSMSTYTLIMGAAATTTGQGDVTGIVKRTTILPNVNYTMGNEFSYITFPNTGTLPSQMSMKITIGTAPSWQSGAVKRAYDFIQTGGTGTKAVINAHYLDGELNGNIENKLVDFSNKFTGPVLTEHGKSNFNTTQNWIALSNVNVAFFASTFGNVELSFDETALTTITWNGSTSTSWITATNWTPNGGPSTNTVLIIPDAATTPNDPYLPATASNGSLTIESGGILRADPGAQLTLNNSGLVWSNNGTFNAGNSTVLFTNANATINGTTNFNNVTINSGAELLMSSGTIMRIAGTMTNSGTWRPGLLNNTVEYNGNNQTVINPNGSTQAYYDLIINGSGTTVLPAASLNIVGNLTINSAVSTSGNTIVMGGTGAQTINGTAPISLNSLSINNSAGVSVNQNVNVNNVLTFTAGKLAIGNNTLTLLGNVVNTVSNGITGSLGSNIIVNGTVSPLLSFNQAVPGISNALNNFTINSSGQVALLASDAEVNGTMTFSAGKMGINGNTLTLKGALVNTVAGGLRGSATSNLIISGGVSSTSLSFDQSIPGTTNQLNNFTLNSTGQVITLANSLNTAGTLNLADGILTTTSVNILKLTAAASVTGGSDLSFINGPLTRVTNAAGAYNFPVGKTNVYRPAVVTPVAAATGTYTAEYFPASTPTGGYAVGLTAIATNEYWDINKASGPDAQVGLMFNGVNIWSVGNPTSMDIIFVAGLNGGVWSPVYGNTITGNTGSGGALLTSTPLSSFSSLTFGYSQNAALPVTLVNFKATRVHSDIELSWTTDNEYSFHGFELERSSDSRNFYKIAFVSATNTSFTKAYSHTDNNPLPGINYYRLKTVDIDGAFKYSAVIKMDVNVSNDISVYPNPVVGNTITLQMKGQHKGDYALSLFDLNGKRITGSKIMHDGNNSIKHIPVNSNVIPGIYYLDISNGQQTRKTIKVLIQ